VFCEIIFWEIKPESGGFEISDLIFETNHRLLSGLATFHYQYAIKLEKGCVPKLFFGKDDE